MKRLSVILLSTLGTAAIGLSTWSLVRSYVIENDAYSVNFYQGGNK